MNNICVRADIFGASDSEYSFMDLSMINTLYHYSSFVKPDK